nr:hypothetical protein [Candidatus Sigynarchaeota archaeon]
MILQGNSTIGFWYELFVLACVGFMTMLTLAKYFQKNKNPLAFILFIIFLNWTIAVFFSWLAKLFSAYLSLEGIHVTDFASLLIRLILDFRLLFVFVSIALYASYLLRVKLFDKEYKKGERVLITIFAIATPALSLFWYQEGLSVDTTTVFLIVFAFMFIVYSTIMNRSIKAFKKADAKYKGAFLSLALMALFFIATFLNFFLDQLLITLSISTGYTVFYFLAWACAIIGNVLTYFGYIKPRGN